MAIKIVNSPPEMGTKANFELFSLNAAGSALDLAVDGTTPKKFEVKASANLVVQRVNFMMQSAAQPTDLKFGSLSALSNGLLVQHIDTDGTTVLNDFMCGLTIKANNHFNLLAGIDTTKFSNTNNRTIAIRWTVGKASKGNGFFLKTNEKLRITVQDNISTLTNFWAMSQGYLL